MASVRSYEIDVESQQTRPSVRRVDRQIQRGQRIADDVRRFLIEDLGMSAEQVDSRWDFSLPTYETQLRAEAEVFEAAGLSTSREIVQHKLASLATARRADVSLSGGQGPGVPHFAIEWTWQNVLSKVIAGLGLKEIQDALFEDEVIKGLVQGEVGAGGTKKNLKDLIKRIIDHISSKEFSKKLSQKLGAKVAGKILGGLAARAIPILGWALVIGSVVWAILEQVDFDLFD